MNAEHFFGDLATAMMEHADDYPAQSLTVYGRVDVDADAGRVQVLLAVAGREICEIGGREDPLTQIRREVKHEVEWDLGRKRRCYEAAVYAEDDVWR